MTKPSALRTRAYQNLFRPAGDKGKSPMAPNQQTFADALQLDRILAVQQKSLNHAAGERAGVGDLQ